MVVAAIIIFLATGCSDKEAVMELSGPTASLQLRLSVLNSKEATKAGENIGFEPPSTQYEKLNSVRVIVVSAGTVEINDLTTDLRGIDFIEKRYEVIPNQLKTVYLIANEQGFHPMLDGRKIRFDEYVEGSALPVNFSDITIQSDNTGIIIDNELKSEKSYLPMSEVFEIFVGPPSQIGESEYSVDFFLTRATTKFGFEIDEESDITDDIIIKRITVSSLANCQYFFPKETDYIPSKYQEAPGGRIISSFISPRSELKEIAFTPPSLSRIWNARTGSYTCSPYFPEKYYAETDASNFSVAVEGILVNEIEEREFSYSSPSLPNLPLLPRNTFVRIKIRFKKGPDNIVVDVIPYIGIELDPEFGFEEPLPRPPATESERPPWIIVDENGEFAGN